MTQELIVAGASGFGREVAWLAEQIAEGTNGEPRVVCFADDNSAKQGCVINDLPVTSLEAARGEHPNAALTIAVGDPAVRREMTERATRLGFTFATLVHPRVERSRWVEIGEGTVICAGNIITTNVNIGRHVHVNLDCTIGHDAILEDFVTLAPGVHVSGQVRIEAGAYVGTGATIINGRDGEQLIIGAGAVVGAGACVTRNIPAGVTAVGVPAKPLSR